MVQVRIGNPVSETSKAKKTLGKDGGWLSQDVADVHCLCGIQFLNHLRWTFPLKWQRSGSLACQESSRIASRCLG
jgi:hypothetical protein